MLDVAYAGRHLLLTGDLEQSGLDELVAQPRPEPPPDVMLAPHHGGRAANPEWLYEWARPRLVVVSQRPPSTAAGDALAAIERLGIPVLRTWRHGAIRISLDRRRHHRHAHSWTRTTRNSRQSGSADPERASRPGPTRALAAERVFAPTLVDRRRDEAPGGTCGLHRGAIACLILAVVEIGAWALVMPYRSVARAGRRTRRQRAREPVSRRSRARAARRGAAGGPLVSRPGPSATGRTVLLLHGFAETSSVLEAARAAALNRHGWNVAALDSRGYGQSEGHLSTFGGREARRYPGLAR